MKSILAMLGLVMAGGADEDSDAHGKVDHVWDYANNASAWDTFTDS